MLETEENEELTQVGVGTPGGELLRRYWHPVAAAEELTPERPKKQVRLLSEDLVLFRDANDEYGLLAERCLHRGASLFYGFLEDGGIRCSYHGWKYDKQGSIVETPFEPAQSPLKTTLRQPAYPVIKVRGILFAYLGPSPVPLFPPWDVVVREEGTHEVDVHPVIDANWLQVQETNADPAHNSFLHYQWGYVLGVRDKWEFQPMEFDFEICDWGLIKDRRLADGSRDDARLAIFPNLLGPSWENGRVLIYWRTPVDDTHTQTFGLRFHPSADGRAVHQEGDPPVNYVSLKDDDGYFHMRSNPSQDSMAWETQGALRDRTLEHLGVSDRGVIMWRRLLKEQIEKVKRGEDPMGVVREEDEYPIIELSRAALNRPVRS